MSETCEEVRIIAKDARGISPGDRATILRMADELESAQRLLGQTQAWLLESQQHRIALVERVAELKKPDSVTIFPTYGSQTALWGWGYARV